MSPSNRTRRRATKAALIAAPFTLIAALGELAALAPRLSVALILAVFGGCGLVYGIRRYRPARLPVPADAPLPAREPAQLAA